MRSLPSRLVPALLGLAASGLLSACAQTAWTKPGGTQQQLSSDRYRCERESLQTAPIDRQVTSVSREPNRRGRGSSTSVSTTDVNQSARERLEYRCMQAAGWRLTEVAQARPPAPQAGTQAGTQPAAPKPAATTARPAIPAAAAAGCQTSARVFAFTEGAWFPAKVLARQDDGCKVRYDDDDSDELVAGTNLMLFSASGPGAALQRCQRGDAVLALSEGGWYPATVKDTRSSGACPIHYSGFPNDDDEELPVTRLRRF
jgi:hypothetical protein